MSAEPGVTVLGAGIVGICTALSLAERGVAVRVIDRGAPGGETSSGNAGVISPWSVIPQSLPGLWRKIPGMMFGPHRPLGLRLLALPSMLPWGVAFLRRGTEARLRHASDAMAVLCGPSIDLYRRHLDGTGAEHLVKDSAYVLAFRGDGPGSLDALEHRIRREKGAQMELVGGDELRRVEPALSSEFTGAVLIHGQARALSPARIATVLAEKARCLGVRFERAEVTAIAPGPGQAWTVTAGDRRFEAARLVLALGAWSRDLLRPLGIRVPLMAERGYHVEFPEPGLEIANSVMDTDAKVVASSMEGGVRVAGQAEFGPVDAPPDPAIARRMARHAQRMFPDLSGPAPRTWMGRRPSLPDSLPMLGPFAGHPGLHAAFGHSHWGLMMAPKTGEILADLLTGRHANAPLEAVSPERFSSRWSSGAQSGTSRL